MDDPNLDPAEHAAALRGLARLNRWSMAAGTLWTHVRPFAATGRPLRLLDVATGSGDIPIALAAFARRDGITLDLHACDASPFALAAASQRAAAARVALTVHCADVLHDVLPGGFDVATCSLFLHHLDECGVVAALAAMAAAARTVIIGDLRRSPPGVALAWLASRALSRSRVVHTDAVFSARAAWTDAELASLADRAGLRGASIRPVAPCRMVLCWTDPAPR